MATRMWLAAYAGAARGAAQLRLRAGGADRAPARGLLVAIDGAGALTPLEPVVSGSADWALTVAEGPVLCIQTADGPVTLGPTRPASPHRGAEFHLALVAATPDPSGPVIVRLERDGKALMAVGRHDNGGVVADQEVEAPGRTLDIYLEA